MSDRHLILDSPETIYIILGWSLRKLGVVKKDSLLVNNKDLGWRYRPGFEWQFDDYKPTDKALQKGHAALDLARNQLKGGWDK